MSASSRRPAPARRSVSWSWVRRPMTAEGGRSEVPDLAGALEVSEHAERLLDVRLGFRPVDLVQVDVIGAEAAERVLDLARDPQPGVAVVVLSGAHLPVDLGRQDDVVPTAFERLADDLFVRAVGVD